MAPLLLILAPIQGSTDVVYRNAFARSFSGFSRAIAPLFQLVQGQPLRPSDLSQITPDNNQALKTIPQVLTNHAPTFSSVVRQLRHVGHAEVNWNLGCPYPMVAGRGRGAGLLPHPDRIDAILSEIHKDKSIRLSVKLRLGYHDPDEYLPLMTVLNRYPLMEVILHPRTADQMYDGTVDRVRAKNFLNLCRHPFIYSGDITRTTEFQNLQQELSGTTAWMIGRGALANPFLPSQLQGTALPPVETRRRLLLEFHNLLLEGYRQRLSGSSHLMDKMQRQWEYLALSFANPNRILSRLHHTEASRYETDVAWAFDQPLADLSTT